MFKKIIKFLLILMALSACKKDGDDINTYLKSKGIRWDGSSLDKSLNSFTMVDNQSSDSINIKTFMGANGTIVKVQFIPAKDEKEALEILESRAQLIKELFQTRVDQYLGKIELSKDCLKKNQIQNEIFQNKFESHYVFNLMATQGFAYGTCSAQEERYKSQYLILYCKRSSKLLEIKLYYEKEKNTFQGKIAECD